MMEKKSTFDLVSNSSDHRFRHHNIHRNFTDSNSYAYKRIMNDWKILTTDLPDSIHVQAYEHRIDLLRAVIIGTPGTPYQEGLFFFDIAFPKSYPFKPPKVHYISFGYKLNPDLYPFDSRSWTPAMNLLTVLLTIQAVVLNEESKAYAYNASAFVLTCRSAICLIRKPPKNFEEFVKEHFRERGHVLLNACKEYANGRVRAGHYGYNCSNNNMAVVKVTKSFRVSLQSVYSKMYKKFIECGASLESFGEELEIEAPEQGNRTKGRNGIFVKAMGRIKQALGWKKNST